MKNRKIIKLLICTALVVTVTGCEISTKKGGSADSKPAGTAQEEGGVNPADENAQTPAEIPAQVAASQATLTAAGDDTAAAPKGEEGIDVDLTLMSSTMVYSEVYDMLMYPEKYMGKCVKMSGMYTMYYDEDMKKCYHSCIIMDATACCAQGIEFELTDEDAYPEEDDAICVVGTFDTYKEGEYTYCTLRNARLV